jgi:hypothetical protein
MSRLSHRPHLTPITFALEDNICFLADEEDKKGAKDSFSDLLTIITAKRTRGRCRDHGPVPVAG